MATKRKPINSGKSKLNFRPTNDPTKAEPKGTTPTTTPTSVKEIVTLMILHICRKSIFFDTNLKICVYLGALFAVSLIADVFPIPKSYLSKSSNVFNQYFVKIAWGWNLLLLIPYVLMTSFVYCCGLKERILKHHLVRLAIATFFWWFWTSLFEFIEVRYGRCTARGEQLRWRQSCLKAGHVWNGFDISGHSFILIYGSLILIEEAKSILSWDSIKEHIRLEDHYRTTKDTNINMNPLRSLSDVQLRVLQINYEKFTPYIRGLFVVMTLFQLLWDIMLISTMLYFHKMIEKFVGGACAILTWYFTYRFWYSQTRILPRLPGDGLFRYIKLKSTASALGRKRSSVICGDVPRFMGMPLYGLRTDNGNLSNVQTDDLNR
ncbi:hypothetical protein PPYR_03286 [Photinus pyralis]|uniref:FIT family protein n=1 Tax=Photinus pyralis TaxID=7054 RepID=A0A1Y1MRG4_PHOPY|nr:fat storage-inducing transmembrane protein [Photinus pyralis]KAB0791486.1 hypothetical protein PPYR_03286 [Photinus pyralis]